LAGRPSCWALANILAEFIRSGYCQKAEDKEKDIGIIVAQAIKFSSQCVALAKSATKTLGMISRTFVNKEKEVMLILYQTLVRLA